MNELMSDEGVCRTGPATPGLVNVACSGVIMKPLIVLQYRLYLPNIITCLV